MDWSKNILLWAILGTIFYFIGERNVLNLMSCVFIVLIGLFFTFLLDKFGFFKKKMVEKKSKKVVIPEKLKSPVAIWLRIGSYVIIGLSVLDSILHGETGISYIISGIIGIWCGGKCASWAVKIKKSPNWAYVIGFILGLVGLLIYYIYYKIKSKKK